MENGEWRMENGEWRMENGEWRMENGSSKFSTFVQELFMRIANSEQRLHTNTLPH